MLKLKTTSLNWALRHVESYGDTDIFPVPFEFAAIRNAWAKHLRGYLANEDIHGWSARPFRRCLSPKHRYGFRVSTQLDPLDTLIFTALVYDVGKDIEAARVPTTDQTVFSHRFKPGSDGRFYDAAYTYDTFQDRSSELAGTAHCKCVVVADIADFFPRLYLHPLENALAGCTKKKDHVTAIKSLVKHWQFHVSYGLPVGPAASRLLAELAIDDVDRALQSDRVVYCRYSDDFRIFCSSRREAHERLAHLANVLYENHGLTLQQHKTRVVGRDYFVATYVTPEGGHEAESLTKRFAEILTDLGIENPYDDINYEDLTDDIKERIDALNLRGILEEQIAKRSVDVAIVRFVLRRLGQLDDAIPVELVLSNIERLYVVFRDVLDYLTCLRSLGELEKKKIGKKLMKLLDRTIVGHLEYHRSWVFQVFADGKGWNNEKDFPSRYEKYSDPFTRRALILAMGRAHTSHWFKTRKRSVDAFGPWERRAFLAAASCLPGDEAGHWYRSIGRKLDPLDTAVVQWAKANPF